jgi:tetratricopeptide (TPR) repeat protein
MRSIYKISILLLVFVTLAQCQTAVDWYIKGDALASQGKYDEAVQAYDQAIKLNPSYDNAWYNKGVALKALGRTNESNAAFARAKNLTTQFFVSDTTASGISAHYASAYTQPGIYPMYYPAYYPVYYPGYWGYYPAYYYPWNYYSNNFVISSTSLGINIGGHSSRNEVGRSGGDDKGGKSEDHDKSGNS